VSSWNSFSASSVIKKLRNIRHRF